MMHAFSKEETHCFINTYPGMYLLFLFIYTSSSDLSIESSWCTARFTLRNARRLAWSLLWLPFLSNLKAWHPFKTHKWTLMALWSLYPSGQWSLLKYISDLFVSDDQVHFHFLFDNMFGWPSHLQPCWKEELPCSSHIPTPCNQREWHSSSHQASWPNYAEDWGGYEPHEEPF